MANNYNVIVPSLINAGPVNIALDLAREAVEEGWTVNIYYLGARDVNIDTAQFNLCRKFKIIDLFSMQGVVHTHCLKPDLLGFFLLRNRKCKVISTVHNYFLHDLKYNYSKFVLLTAWVLWKVAISKLDRTICISNSMYRYYERCIGCDNLDVIYNFRSKGCLLENDDENFLSWVENRRLKKSTVLAFVGSINERKNIIKFISAIKETENLSVVICGNGNQVDVLLEKIDDERVKDRFYFVGHTTKPMSYVQHSNMLVLPSFAEGFPLVVLEAASVGIPSLLSNIAVHREICNLGFGLTFDHHSFGNLNLKVSEVAHLYPAPNSSIFNLWKNKFTSKIGFLQYQNILNSLNLELLKD